MTQFQCVIVEQSARLGVPGLQDLKSAPEKEPAMLFGSKSSSDGV